jgi:hypothetical protein
MLMVAVLRLLMEVAKVATEVVVVVSYSEHT